MQVSAGPGFADSQGEESRRSFTASARYQFDLRSRISLVASGLFRDTSDVASRNGAAGVAVGVAPTSRLTLWAQADASFRQGASGDPGYTLLGDVAFEVYRGVWVRFSPQLRTDVGDSSEGTLRFGVGLNWLPRTHWNVLLSYFHDRNRKTDAVIKTWIAQLHIYL